MALDATMLDLGHSRQEAMWRCYGWTEPAMTFGYSQRWAVVRQTVQGFEGSLVRRLTGGGIVDHRNDLTYALSIPPDHPFFRKPALELYRELHEGISRILAGHGNPATLAPCDRNCGNDGPSAVSTFCFPAAEPYDVIQPGSGKKIAGAAMKRNRAGILVQGSIDRPGLQGVPTGSFVEAFREFLAEWLRGEAVTLTGPLPGDILQKERQRFGSASWNQRR